MEIYITGDLHGDLRRFQPEIFYEQETLTKEDIVLVAGDFGCVWHGDGQDDENLDWLEGWPFTTAFVTGNHENYDALRKYPLEEWHGGLNSRQSPAKRVCREGEEQGSVWSFRRRRKRNKTDFATSRAGPAATTSRTASWSRMILCSRKNAGSWMPGVRCTG